MQPDKLIEGIVELKSKFKNGKDLYNFILYRRDFNLSMLERGIDFFILNRITFSGIVDSGGFSQKAYESRFTISSIDRLKNTYRVIKNFNFSCDNFFNLVNSDLDNQKDIFIFLDPPYYSSIKSKLYGKKGILHSNFNHENLRDYLYQTKSKFLLTYDNCEYIKELYKDFYMLEWNLQYGMNNYKQKNADIGKDWIKTKSDYCYKKTAKNSLINLLDNINANHIVMSYSTDGIIEFDDLISILENKGDLKIATSEYVKYRGAKRSIVNKTKNIEYLFIIDARKSKIKNYNNDNHLKIKYIENIRLKLNNPVNSSKDYLLFEGKEGNIKLNLKYSVHIINVEEICAELKNKSVDYIKRFSLFLDKYIKENNLEALKIYFSHLKKASLINDIKLIKYFANHILKIYARLCSKKSNEYILDITSELLDIIYKYDNINAVNKIKKRMIYNISHSGISDIKKNKILNKI